jgi:mannose/cellobiose epimerase-like protein (N-acyl-D-glucosamine 2-epimerase family)
MNLPSPVSLPSSNPSAGWLNGEASRLLGGAEAARAEQGGFWWLDADGQPDRSRPRFLWVTTRMTHCFSIGALLGHQGAGDLADHGVAGLLGAYRDSDHGGWFEGLDDQGPIAGPKGAYGHAFVLLAGASATVAERPRGRELLEAGIDVVNRYFWDDEAGAMIDEWDRAWTTCDPYRGANANMHTLEAFLAVADATGDSLWRRRALRIADRMVNREARSRAWRLAEHFDSAWNALPEYNVDQPAHPFRPYGVTPGHGLEWARLLLHLEAALPEPPDWLREGAINLFDRAVADGWYEDTGGIAYTTDWDGRPVVQQRFHWVICEGIGAAAALYRATGDTRYATWYERMWQYARRSYLTGQPGWLHEVDGAGLASFVTWSGRPDVYHAFQATLIPQLPLVPALTLAVREAMAG